MTSMAFGTVSVISAIGSPASMSISVTRMATSAVSVRTTGMTPICRRMASVSVDGRAASVIGAPMSIRVHTFVSRRTMSRARNRPAFRA